jgi:hypothetical protein
MEILHLQLQLFLLVAIGYGLSKKGMLSKSTRKQLTDLVIYVVLPCNIVQSFQIDMSHELLLATGQVLILGFAAQGFYALLNLFLYRRFDAQRQINLKYGTICSNAGFMGLPLSLAIFGSTGLMYASVALLPIRLFMWSAGLSLYTSTTRKQVVKTLVTHPCIIAVFVGFALMFSGVQLPTFLDNTIDCLGRCCTALSMVVIGAILSDVDPRTVFEPAAVYYSVIRLLAIPAVLYVVLRLLNVDSLVTGIIVILSAMPAGSTTAMLAQKYEQAPEFASKMVFISTLASLVTLPLWALLLT